MSNSFEKEIAALLPWRKGHFRFESGHHGDTWLNLELLCLHPEPVEQLAAVLADCLSEQRGEVICGPLVEGAFVAMMVARRLRLPFTYTERFDPSAVARSVKADAKSGALFPISYRLPGAQRELVAGKRVVIVNDVIGAGSAVLSTLKDLYECGADPVAIGALAARGQAAMVLARENGLVLETLATFPGELWKPAECPMCAAGIPLTDTSMPAAT
jgi:orotate phosphoribosyltransferase